MTIDVKLWSILAKRDQKVLAPRSGSVVYT